MRQIDEMDRVRTASEQDAREAAVSLCQAVERDRYVDDEMLMFAGRALGSAGHAGIDDVVMRSFGETRTDRRLEVAGSILEDTGTAGLIGSAAML